LSYDNFINFCFKFDCKLSPVGQILVAHIESLIDEIVS
jgi:hypothetical protein